MTKVSDVIAAIEKVAPLKFQDEWDNSGLQVGFASDPVRGVLVCLDVTEEIVDEAVRRGCTMIVSHHPLLFHSLRQVSDSTYQQRCVARAIKEGIAIYSAHTSLDNARGGVNFKIAELIGLQDLRWLEPKNCCGEPRGPLGLGTDKPCGPASPGTDTPGGDPHREAPAGSGLIGTLEKPESKEAFLDRLQKTFQVKSLRHSEPDDSKPISKVALCGGSGAFLMDKAAKEKADCFVTGEFHYHDYFERDGMLLVELGHYQSEQFTKDLLRDILSKSLPGLRIEMTQIDTNPIRYR